MCSSGWRHKTDNCIGAKKDKCRKARIVHSGFVAGSVQDAGRQKCIVSNISKFTWKFIRKYFACHNAYSIIRTSLNRCPVIRPPSTLVRLPELAAEKRESPRKQSKNWFIFARSTVGTDNLVKSEISQEIVELLSILKP